MGKLHEKIDDKMRHFIESQRMFFVATAPSGSEGHVNLSPKGLDSFRVLDSKTVAYLDFIGSGAETIAHLRENGRIVIMMCAFEGPPRIVRFYGSGEVVEPEDASFRDLRPLFPGSDVARAIIRVEVNRIADSCGHGVPVYEYRQDRPQLFDWADRKGEQGRIRYQREKNSQSIDGLPALRWPDEQSG